MGADGVWRVRWRLVGSGLLVAVLGLVAQRLPRLGLFLARLVVPMVRLARADRRRCRCL